MADEYIKREDAIEILWYNQDECGSAIVSDIEAIPAADVRPVVRGRWVHGEYGPYCSNCDGYPPTRKRSGHPGIRAIQNLTTRNSAPTAARICGRCKMIEGYIAWLLLGFGLVKSDGLYLIASSVFACAAQLFGIKKRMREVQDDD